MAKKDKRALQRQLAAKQSSSAQASQTATTPAAKPASPSTALSEITEAHKATMGTATEHEMISALDAPPTTDVSNINLVEAAKLINETIALLQARGASLTKRESETAEIDEGLQIRMAELNARSASLEESERNLTEAKSRFAGSEQKLTQHESELHTRELSMRERELNAEAGFSAERRASMKMLDGEVAALRDNLASLRSQIVSERAGWEAERLADEKRWRTERATIIAAQEAALSTSERANAEQFRLDREQLSKDRAEMKASASKLAIAADVLREDTEAFDARVEQRAGYALEKAKADRQDIEARLKAARLERDDLYSKLREREEAERALGNLPIDKVRAKIDSLVRENGAFREQLANRPTQEATERLAVLERAQEEWESERARLMQESVAAKNALVKASIAVTEIETLRDQKAALESARDLLHAALEDLRADVDERIRRADGVSPFPACSLMDGDSALQTQVPVIDTIPDLKAFCVDLQHRIALDPSTPGKVLRYELQDIRSFLGGLSMSRLHLLHGISGTGKTSLPLAVARALGAGSSLVEVQAGWRDRQDLVGHFNQFERRFYESEFLQALYRAKCPRYAGLVNIVVLDEMNLSHPEQYFADLLSALEQDPHLQKLDLMTAPVEPAPAHLRNGRTLPIPQNVWFIGTANHDETTKDFADKTYDRAHVMELPRQRAQFVPQPMQARPPVSFEALRGAFAKARVSHEQKAKEAYDFLDRSFADILGKRFGLGWGNRLERQMLDYVPIIVAAGGSVGEAVDHILATKLLRKVKDRHDTRPEDLTALHDHITAVWPTIDKAASAKLSSGIVKEEMRRLGAEETA